ncbi:hypothetical protein ACLQ3C_09240 [Gordonia sp. DT30]|uniref:hypothetical protein n=1 Tax=Gordonia sp. DT30 TaxID=3416546 RepID=UPI003CEE4C4F
MTDYANTARSILLEATPTFRWSDKVPAAKQDEIARAAWSAIVDALGRSDLWGDIAHAVMVAALPKLTAEEIAELVEFSDE